MPSTIACRRPLIYARPGRRTSARSDIMKRLCQVVAVASIFAGGSVSPDVRSVVSRHRPVAVDIRPAIALIGATALATYAALLFARAMNDDPRAR